MDAEKKGLASFKTLRPMRSSRILYAEFVSTSIWPKIRGKRGQILSVHRRALNLLFGSEGQLVAIVPQAVGKLPNAILFRLPVDSRFSFEVLGLKAGDSVTAANKMIRFPAAELEIRLASAARFPAKLTLETPLDSCPNVLERAAQAARQARQADIRRGLLPLVNYVNEIAIGMRVPDPHLSTLCKRAWISLSSLMRGLHSERDFEVRKAVIELMGLGIGLTPSGDDILTGLMGFLYHSPGTEAATCLLAKAIVEAPEGLTNPISRSYLIHATRGELSERLIHFVGTLIGGSPEGVHTTLRALMRWGHTSGAETALGVVLGAIWAGSAQFERTDGAERHGDPGKNGRQIEDRNRQ